MEHPHFVYILQSEPHPKRYYTGQTSNLPLRLQAHNSGLVRSTESFRPWRVIAYVAFDRPERARRLERYLKTGSGVAFAKRHLR